MALSSESDGYWLFPGTKPTVRMGELKFGTLSLNQRKPAHA
jgi:hypothetical protein